MATISLVLEGGGMRGAYTAGVLAYFIDHDITFDYGVGISAGAINLASYWMSNKEYLTQVAVNYMSDKRNVGVRPLLREGTYVGYNYMFDTLLAKHVKYDLNPLKNVKSNFEVGMYNMVEDRNDWIGKDDITLTDLKAACTLPIAGRPVKVRNSIYMDGGIVTMVPIERAIEQGCDKHFVIITKDSEYVRHPEPAAELNACSFLYRKTPSIVDRLKVRDKVYYHEMGLVEELVSKQQAYLMRPSEKIAVSRFKGDPVGLKNCFDLGYQDASKQHDAIMEFLRG